MRAPTQILPEAHQVHRLRILTPLTRTNPADESAGEITVSSGRLTGPAVWSISVTVPPRLTQSIAVAMVSLEPTVSSAISTPRAPGPLQDLRRQLGPRGQQGLFRPKLLREL